MSDREVIQATYELAVSIHKRTLRLESTVNQMALDLTALQAAVAQETAVDQSVETLLTTLAAELSTANDAGDTAAIAQIVTTMQTNAAALGAAVTANTPATPAPPTPPAS
jgi:hypothetical protein